jgi:hypothetical protein
MTKFPIVLVPPALQGATPQRLQQGLSQTVLPSTVSYRPPRGHAERQFERDLWRYFPGRIHSGLVMQPKRPAFEQTSERTSAQAPKPAVPYAPDFVYIDATLNLHIDIELDEPYTYDTRQPLHYCDCPKDRLRNQRFLDWGWVVIRFSERQAVKSPDGCCKAIASLIATLTQDSSIMVPFRQVSTLKPERCWTKAEAEQMAVSQFRDSYLKSVVSEAHRTPVQQSAVRRKPQASRPTFAASSLTFYCPECGEGPIRWQGHYIACPTCRYDAFAL